MKDGKERVTQWVARGRAEAVAVRGGGRAAGGHMGGGVRVVKHTGRMVGWGVRLDKAGRSWLIK